MKDFEYFLFTVIDWEAVASLVFPVRLDVDAHVEHAKHLKHCLDADAQEHWKRFLNGVAPHFDQVVSIQPVGPLVMVR